MLKIFGKKFSKNVKICEKFTVSLKFAAAMAQLMQMTVQFGKIHTLHEYALTSPHVWGQPGEDILEIHPE